MPWIWIGGLTGVLGLAAAGWFVLGPGRSRDQPAPEETASRAANAANDVLLEGARKDLQYGNFRGALEAANNVQSADPSNPEAHRIAQAASQKLAEIDDAAEALAAARAAGRRDKGKADLEKLMALDPGHPQVDQSTKWLNETFMAEARQAQDKVKRAADQARRVPGRDSAQYDRAMSMNREAEALISKGQYAEAAQKFSEAANRFGRSLAAPRIPPVVVVVPTPPLYIRPHENHPAAIPVPLPTPSVATVASPTATFEPTSRPAPPTSAPTPPVNTDDADIRRVIHGLASAIETGNITLYKQLRPSLSSGDERRLRDSFSRVRQRIVVDIRSIEVDGNHATAQVGWTVTVPGERPVASIQRYGLAKGPAGWYIERVN